METDEVACTAQAKKIIDNGKLLGINGEAIEVFDGNDERDYDTSHTVVAFNFFGKRKVTNQQQTSNYGEIDDEKLNSLEQDGLAEKNTELDSVEDPNWLE